MKVDIIEEEREMYPNSDITSDEDWPIRAELDSIEHHIKKVLRAIFFFI